MRREKRRPKDPDKIGRAMRSERSEQQASKVRATERAIERLDVVEKPWEGWRLQLRLASGRGGGRRRGGARGRGRERGSFRLGPVDLDVRRGRPAGRDRAERRRQEHADRGAARPRAARGGPRPDRARRSWSGEIEQERTALFGAPRLLDAVIERSGLRAQEARTLLAKFALDADRVDRPAEDLSPGERTRALLAILAAREVTCLVLDEPTNHLDLEAIEQLEDALERLRGHADPGDPRPTDAGTGTR